MQLESYRTVFATITLIGILLFASPGIAYFIEPPAEEHFTALYMLGPNHDLNNVPFKIEADQNYSVYLGVSNYMGSAGYYSCVVKFGNDTNDFPDTDLGLHRSLHELYRYNLFITNGETWENMLTFQFNGLTFSQNKSQLSSITINGLNFVVNKDALWNSNRTGYIYSLIVELWIYNSTLGTLQFNNRSVHLLLNAQPTNQ
jgi:uncharacterized membrane protein